MEETRIRNLEELSSFAERIAASLNGGDVVGLVGDLGAGKTTFVQRLAAALGVKKEVRSPTFILMQCFDVGTAAKKKGIARLCHVDAYRLKDERELEVIGFAEFAERKDTVTIVEWADKLPSLRSRPGYKELRFELGKGDERVVSME